MTAVHATNGRYVALALLAQLASCVTGATEVLCGLDTDIPADVPVTVHIAARAGVVDPRTDGGDTVFMRTAPDGTVTLPGTFAVVPAPGGPRDGVVSVAVEAVTPAYTLRRVVRFSFVPGRSLFVPIFLTTRCAASATDCTTVPSDRCTVQQSCEDRGLTCGDEGACVAESVTPGELADSATGLSGGLGTLRGAVSSGSGVILSPTLRGPTRSCVGTSCLEGSLSR